MGRRKEKKKRATLPAGTQQAARQKERQGAAPPRDFTVPQTGAPSGLMRRSTAFVGMSLALCLGLFAGSLLPSFFAPPSRTGQTSSPPAIADALPPKPTEQRSSVIPRELEQKIRDTEKALQDSPNAPALWVALGNAHFDAQNPAQAIHAYERALALAPDNPDVLTDLGIMYRESGKFDQALAAFRKAQAINPEHANAFFNEGVVLYYDLHRRDEAVNAWQKLLKFNPDARSPNGERVSSLIEHLH